jgi:hypothetical protein
MKRSFIDTSTGLCYIRYGLCFLLGRRKMKRLLVFMLLISLTSVVYGWDFEDDYSAPSATEYGTPSKTEQKVEKAPEKSASAVSGKRFQLAFGTSLINVYHMVDFATLTTIGFPFTSSEFAAGYKLVPNLWLMGKAHLFMTVNGDAAGHFIIGPGLRGDFIDNDLLTFFGGGYLSIGNTGKTFIFSPEGYTGIEFKLLDYLALGAKLRFAYELYAAKNNTAHCINFGVGAHLAVYF